LSTFAAEAVGLKKSYGYHRVLNGVNFNLRSGEHLVIVGRNGCGKTTLINILATLLNPSEGIVFFDGLDFRQKASEIRLKLGYVGHFGLLYSALTIRENLRFYGRMYSVPALETRVDELIANLDLTKWQDRKVSEISRGTQQRASIARGIIHKPSILLLDEPESGLDPAALVILEKMLQDFKAQGGGVLAASHNLEYSLKTSDRIVVLNNGRLEVGFPSAQISAAELKSVIAGQRLKST
jgi:heme exporter protein A